MHTTRPKIQIKRSIVNRSPCIVGAPVELEYDPEEQVEQAEAPESHTSSITFGKKAGFPEAS